MPQYFSRSANSFARFTILGAAGALVAVCWLGVSDRAIALRNDAECSARTAGPFSHEHHVGGIGIDCRYCHTSVEDSSFANIPPTKTCMNCHSQIWATSPMLEPVRESFRDRTSRSSGRASTTCRTSSTSTTAST